MDKKIISLGAKIELARRDFFYYSQLRAPDFYKSDRTYLRLLCRAFQNFYEGDDEVLILNIPPRHGKSRTAGLFVEWALGQNQKEKIMTGSYNETLSTVFSKNVRDAIQEEKADIYKAVYTDVFPGVRIKYGDAAANLWSLENGYNNYLATSPGGTATGFGATLMLLDDLIRNAEEAYNEGVLDKHWSWYTNTMLSRLEEGGKIIIIMTRWASGDLAGRAVEHYKEEGKKVKHVVMKAQQDDGTMLCDEVLSYKSYKSKVRAMGEDIASANYQQKPIDIKGRLYNSFKTYDKTPENFDIIRSYTDTADTGEDYLCNIVYGVKNKEAYILDVLYTKEPMEITEVRTAKMLFEYNVNIATIESNNGGRGFSRQVKTILMQQFKTNKTVIKWFHQSDNKKARILSNSSWVMEHIYFPSNWKDRFPEYYKAMYSYQREGKNKNDDAPDATTGVAEIIVNKTKGKFDRDKFGI
ncbi:phage terminase large subunit [Metaclostridioides mangenotii]|uniref:phage terminase large subunit n=1 Tax=Metaclostridioides mangenotii TaxID=1540 RepID=UPI00048A396A|nr:phage terminase large subunit [Clostridioides mangenotii]